MLKAEHLLENIPQKGVFCRNISIEEVNNACIIAEAVEGIIAYDIAQNSSASILEKLGKSVSEMETALINEDKQAWNDADFRFHTELRDLGNSTITTEVLDRVALHIGISSRCAMKSAEFREYSFMQYRGIYEAIKSGDAEHARSLVNNHWESVRKQINKKINMFSPF